MDLHRLRVVEFDTSVREKEREKKNIAELDACKEEDGNASTVGNKDQIADKNRQNDNKAPPGLSQKCLLQEISPSGTSMKYLDVTASPPAKSNKTCVNDKITPPRTSENYINVIKTARHPESSKILRSKSEIFKSPPKRKPRRRALKINSSDISLQKLFQDTAYSNRKKRKIKRNRNINTRVHHNEKKEKEERSEEVQFLFARETPSFIRYRRKRTEKEKSKKQHNSKLPNDIYGFQKSNRSMDRCQYYMSSFNFLDIDKLPLVKLRGGLHRKPKPAPPLNPCFCKHHAMRVLKSTYGYGLNGPMFYNLGSHCYPRRYRQKTVKVDRSCRAKDVTIEVSSSSLKSTSFRDAGTGPSKVKPIEGSSHHALPRVFDKSTTLQSFTRVNDQKPCPLFSTPKPCAATSHHPPTILKNTSTIQDVAIGYKEEPCPCPGPSTPDPCKPYGRAKIKCKKKRHKPKRNLVLLLCKGLVSSLVKHITNLHTKYHISGKGCIKSIFFGLLIVVWSPCLLAVILAWVVMFPWKLTNILKTDVSKRSFSIYSFKKNFRKKSLRREYQKMCFEDYMPKQKKSVMTTAVNWYSRTVGAVAKSFNAVISLLKVKKEPSTTCSSYFLPDPNPRKRYTLFYADRRGWVMKPSRRRTRSSASNRVMQSMRCEIRPKCWRKSGCLDLLQRSCPLQSTHSVWPGCTFWNNYASKSVRLESNHRRRQQPYSPGYGRKRKSTAEGGVRQPYPDFNRVSMRYAGRAYQPRQLRRSTNNYPPAPGATPPRNYMCDPCYTNPPNKCVLRPSYDESALRRAYKRRPLRYTPPSQQLPRVVMKRKILDDKKRAAERKKKKKRKENIFRCCRRVLKETDRSAWPKVITCHPMWLNTLKRKPCFCIYKVWPRVYPAFLSFYKTQQYVGQLLAYFLTLCFWSPLLLCGYMCCSIFE